MIGPSSLPRALLQTAREQLVFAPAVALLGPRQVGKTTLAKAIGSGYPGAISLDLQLAGDREKLAAGSGFLQAHRGVLVVLDEVQYVPDVFAQLRPEIDADRRPGRFLLLGSASGKLLAQSSESLAGRVSYLELTPLQVREVMPEGAAVIYRTSAGAELDVVVDTGSKKYGFEVKFSSAPKVTKGFWQACQDVGVQHAFVLAPVAEGWPMKSPAAHTIDVISPAQLAWALAR